MCVSAAAAEDLSLQAHITARKREVAQDTNESGPNVNQSQPVGLFLKSNACVFSDQKRMVCDRSSHHSPRFTSQIPAACGGSTTNQEPHPIRYQDERATYTLPKTKNQKLIYKKTTHNIYFYSPPPSHA